MDHKRFVEAERAYQPSLDAIEEVMAKSLAYSAEFKKGCMRRHPTDEKPVAIFASADLHTSLIGYKRIKHAIYYWKDVEAKDTLTATESLQLRHRNRVDTIKREKLGIGQLTSRRMCCRDNVPIESSGTE